MIPPMPTGAPVASQIRQSWPVSPRPGPGRPRVRSTPSSVVTGSPGDGPPHQQPAAVQPVEVVGVGGLAELQHHVVGGVDHVVDGSHAGGHQPAGQPAGESRTCTPVSTRAGEPRAELEVVHPHRGERADRRTGRPARVTRRRTRRSHPWRPAVAVDVGHGEGEPIPGGQVPGHPGHAPGVGSVGLDGDVEDHVGFDAQDVGRARPRARPRRRR